MGGGEGGGVFKEGGVAQDAGEKVGTKAKLRKIPENIKCQKLVENTSGGVG